VHYFEYRLFATKSDAKVEHIEEFNAKCHVQRENDGYDSYGG
jgi:hypothetical protein